MGHAQGEGQAHANCRGSPHKESRYIWPATPTRPTAQATGSGWRPSAGHGFYELGNLHRRWSVASNEPCGATATSSMWRRVRAPSLPAQDWPRQRKRQTSHMRGPKAPCMAQAGQGLPWLSALQNVRGANECKLRRKWLEEGLTSGGVTSAPAAGRDSSKAARGATRSSHLFSLAARE